VYIPHWYIELVETAREYYKISHAVPTLGLLSTPVGGYNWSVSERVGHAISSDAADTFGHEMQSVADTWIACD
jgi:hypothetical protein